MELLYICDLKGEWFDFIFTFSQLLSYVVLPLLNVVVEGYIVFTLSIRLSVNGFVSFL